MEMMAILAGLVATARGLVVLVASGLRVAGAHRQGLLADGVRLGDSLHIRWLAGMVRPLSTWAQARRPVWLFGMTAALGVLLIAATAIETDRLAEEITAGNGVAGPGLPSGQFRRGAPQWCAHHGDAGSQQCGRSADPGGCRGGRGRAAHRPAAKPGTRAASRRNRGGDSCQVRSNQAGRELGPAGGDQRTLPAGSPRDSMCSRGTGDGSDGEAPEVPSSQGTHARQVLLAVLRLRP